MAIQTQADFDKLVAGKDASVVGELLVVAFLLLPLKPLIDLCTWVKKKKSLFFSMLPHFNAEMV